jgi:hypothetical protein
MACAPELSAAYQKDARIGSLMDHSIAMRVVGSQILLKLCVGNGDAIGTHVV